MLASAEIELPSLPQVVMRMLEACDSNADYQDLGEIIGNDTALTARVLALANSSYYYRGHPVQSLQQALLRLGVENLRTLVITASLRQFLTKLGADQWQQLRDFWRHSLTTALVARALAHLTRYGNPDEAFLVGMLHNVGELVLLQRGPQAAAAQSAPDTAAAGAAMARDWGLSPLAIDAIRYQHLTPAELQDTPHLVKLISLSTHLAMSDTRGVEAAQTLFGLTAALTREISTRIDGEVESLARGLNISLTDEQSMEAAREALLSRLVQHGMVDQASRLLPRSEDETQLCEATVHAARVLCGGSALVLVAQDDWLVAGAVSDWPELDLQLPREPARSLVGRCAASHQPTLISDPAERVVDRQLLELVRGDSAYASPIVLGTNLYGVLLAGFDGSPAPDRCKLIDLLAQRAARAFHQLRTNGADKGIALEARALETRLQFRQLLHEVSNPLTVIRNYLDALQGRLAKDSSAGPDLDVIREELDRVTNLLMHSRDLQELPASNDTCDLGREVQALTDLLDGALFRGQGVDCDLEIPPDPVEVAMSPGSLRQILLNLSRNAAEAMPDGGSLLIRVRAHVWQSDRVWAELVVEDQGPGLPPDLHATLFQPVRSTKGANHSGLGLSIVKRLVDDSGSVISCYSDTNGTGFRILIPAVTSGAPARQSGQT